MRYTGKVPVNKAIFRCNEASRVLIANCLNALPCAGDVTSAANLCHINDCGFRPPRVASESDTWTTRDA